MERGLGRHRGGIQGLLDLLREHREAVEYDLIRLGLRLDWLGTTELSWRDLLVIVNQARPGSAIAEARNGPASRWTDSEYLLAALVDGVQILAWLQSEDGQKGRNRPTPVPRPIEATTTSTQAAAVSIDEMEAWLSRRNPSQHQAA